MNKKTNLFLLELLVLVVICSLNYRLILGFTWIILHEIAHIIVANSFGVKLYNFHLRITGVSAELKDFDDLNEKKRLIVFLSGPFFNFIAVIVLGILQCYFDNYLLTDSLNINLGILLFNLLPAYPLDGIRAYEILLGRKILYKKAKKILIKISFGVAILMTAAFVLNIYIHKANISLVLAAALITYSTFLEKENTMYIILGNLIKKRRQFIKEDYMENKSLSVYYKKELVKVLSLVDINKFNSFFVLDEELRFLGIVREDELMDALKEYGNITLEELIEKRKIQKEI